MRVLTTLFFYAILNNKYIIIFKERVVDNSEKVKCAYCGLDLNRDDAKLSLTQYVQGFYHLKCYHTVFGHLYTDPVQYSKIFKALIDEGII
jgi:hypothetical protein